MLKPILLSLSLFMTGTRLANAGASADALSAHLYAGTLKEGTAALEGLPDDAENAAAQGILSFVAAIEKLGQRLHRHGLETTQGGGMIRLPIVRMPVPANLAPESLTYEKWRGILESLLADLIAADAFLETGAKGESKLPIDLMRVRVDLDQDGKVTDGESLAGLMAGLTNQPKQNSSIPKLEFAFDKADVIWLRGYVHFLTAALQFGLALDFEDTFNATAHLWFPRAGLPNAEALITQTEPTRGFRDGSLGDALALIHLMNWKVVEPQRLSDSRSRLAFMASLSRESWAAARAETDDDREWLPNAKQKSNFPSMTVNDAMIDTWQKVMSEFEAVLDGKKLLAHWRFEKGINVKRVFDESKQVDIVLLIAGVGALPFIEEGAISTSTEWRNLTRAFGSNFLNYAIWFN